MPKINLNTISYAAIFINLWILFVGYRVEDTGIQLLAIVNMILLTLGLLLRPITKKGDE